MLGFLSVQNYKINVFQNISSSQLDLVLSAIKKIKTLLQKARNSLYLGQVSTLQDKPPHSDQYTGKLGPTSKFHQHYDQLVDHSL